MIVADATAPAIVISGRAAPGEVAYIDAEWLPAEGVADVPAILASSGAMSWSSGPQPVPLDGSDPGSVIASLARRAAARVPESCRAVEVLGEGEVARLVAETLGSRAVVNPAGRPDAIVDTTGSGERIVAATERLIDLGTLVLAGEGRDGSIDLDVYVDVHSRGLVVHGVPLPPPVGEGDDSGTARPAPPAPFAADGAGVAWLERGRRWYAVTFA